MATASLTLGIISMVCGVFGFGFQLGGAVLAVIGIVLSIKEKDPQKQSVAKAGKLCSVIGLNLCLLMFAASVICVQIFHTVVGANLLEELLTYLRELTA